MAKMEDVMSMLGYEVSGFKRWMKDGVILAPDKPNQWSVGSVHNQIAGYYKRELRLKTNTINQQKAKIEDLQAYIMELENSDSINSPEKEKKRLDGELVRKKIEKMDMDNAIRRKEFVPVELFQDVVSGLATKLATDLNQIPMKLKRLVPEMSAHTFDQVKTFLAKTRNMMADYETGETVRQHIDQYNPKGYFDSADTSEDSGTSEA